MSRSATSTRGSSRRRTERRSSSARTSTRSRPTDRSSRCSRTASSATPAARSSAPTTSRRSSRCSKACGACSPRTVPHAGIELLFTPKEEVGLLGAVRVRPHAPARAARLRLRPGGADRRDHPRRAVGAGDGGARSTGAPSHSGMFPEEGRSAIQAAAKAIADLRLGRVDEETTANVGVISGGTAGNIVPEWCTFLAEARSPRRAQAERARAGDARRIHVRRDGDRVRGRDGAAEELPRLPLQAGATTSSRSPRRRSSAAATRRRTRSRAAPPTRTSSTSAACAA